MSSFANQLQRLKPYLIPKQYAQDDIRFLRMHFFQKFPVQLGKITICIPIERLKKDDLMPQIAQGWQEIDIFITLTPGGVPVVMFTEDTKYFHGFTN